MLNHARENSALCNAVLILIYADGIVARTLSLGGLDNAKPAFAGSCKDNICSVSELLLADGSALIDIVPVVCVCPNNLCFVQPGSLCSGAVACFELLDEVDLFAADKADLLLLAHGSCQEA